MKLDCVYLKDCGSCIFETSYDEQIRFKQGFVRELFDEFYSGEFEFFSSPVSKFRSRAEFGIYHDNDGISYSMRGVDNKFVKINACEIVSAQISNLMPILLKKISSVLALKQKLFGVEFISTKNEILVILLYHKDICTIEKELEDLHFELGVNLIARSRGKKLVFGSPYLNETLSIKGKDYSYTFGDAAFIQPNTIMNEKMISWALDCSSNTKDLLELYCGHGNFTIPMSFKFKKVLATEISKNSILSAQKNCESNSAKNIKFLRMSAEELMEAFAKKREFVRLKDVCLDEFDFSHILVDPPRAGCDESVLAFMKKYENIIYISCNPLTLKENLKTLCRTHRISKFAIFDQFVHTKHIECGVLLRKI